MKKVFPIISLLLLFSGSASGQLAGKCGEQLWYSLDLHTGVFTIKGNGPMYSYTCSEVPWSSYVGKIQRLDLPEGLTTISDYAFYGANRLQSIQMPDSVHKIGYSAFAYCGQVDRISISQQADTIINKAFYHTTTHQAVTLPHTIRYVGCDAFNQVDTFYVNQSYAFAIASSSFKSDAVFYIQDDNILSYYLNQMWNKRNIKWILQDGEIPIGQRLFNAVLFEDAAQYILTEEFAYGNFNEVHILTEVMRRLGNEDAMLNFLESIDSIPQIKAELCQYYKTWQSRLCKVRPYNTSYYVNCYDNKDYVQPLPEIIHPLDWRKLRSLYVHVHYLKGAKNDDDRFYGALDANLYHGDEACKESFKWLKECYKTNYNDADALLGYYYFAHTKHNNANLKKARQYTAEGLSHGSLLAEVVAMLLADYDNNEQQYWTIRHDLDIKLVKACPENAYLQYLMAFWSQQSRLMPEHLVDEQTKYWGLKALAAGFEPIYYFLKEKYTSSDDLLNINGSIIGTDKYLDILSHQLTYAELEAKREADRANARQEYLRKEQERILQEQEFQKWMSVLQSVSQFTNALTSTANSLQQILGTSASTSSGSSSSTSGSSSSTYSGSHNTSQNGVQYQQDQKVYLEWENTLIKMKTGVTPVDTSVKQQAQAAMRSIRQKWESRGRSMYHSSLEDW